MRPAATPSARSTLEHGAEQLARDELGVAIVERRRQRRPETRTPRSGRGVLRHASVGARSSCRARRRLAAFFAAGRPRFAFAAGLARSAAGSCAGGDLRDRLRRFLGAAFAATSRDHADRATVPCVPPECAPLSLGGRRLHDGVSHGGAASSTTPIDSRSGGGAPRRPRGRAPRCPMPMRGAGAADVAGGADAATAACSRSRELLRHRRGFGGASDFEVIAATTQVDDAASCASLRIRTNMRSLRLSESRPSSCRARRRTSLASPSSSPGASSSTARRTRSNASLRVRR